MYIGIDLGGTNIAAGIVDDNVKLMYKSSVPTQKERHYSAIIKDMAELVKTIVADSGCDMSDIRAIGIGCPGTIDNSRGMVVYSNNIKMDHVPLVDEFRKYIDVPLNVENDANAAAYGEYIANGNRVNSYVFMTLGTGIGGGIIINGKIYRGFNCAGAEIGHSSIVIDGKTCTCGKKGCLEAYASVTALIEQTAEKMDECPDSMMNEWTKKYGKVSGRTAFECAKAGDKAAIEVKDRYIRYIAEGVSNMINIFQPDMFVIGGGISNEGDELLIPIKEFVYENDYNKYMPKAEIKIAELFNDAGIVGAAMAAVDKA
ncbi:MAG: ROK family protein [Clostridia bacterium]|nr:ROK family protein [Clostridia bacterium]